jgi:hypothetical protein
MGIVAKHIVKKEKAEPKQPTVIGNYAEWRANLNKPQEKVVVEEPVVYSTNPQEEAKVEEPVVEDTISNGKRQPSSKWLSIKDSDYVSHLIK